jgi:hypothetical protein
MESRAGWGFAGEPYWLWSLLSLDAPSLSTSCTDLRCPLAFHQRVRALVTAPKSFRQSPHLRIVGKYVSQVSHVLMRQPLSSELVFPSVCLRSANVTERAEL